MVWYGSGDSGGGGGGGDGGGVTKTPLGVETPMATTTTTAAVAAAAATAADDTAGSRDLVTRLLQLPCGLVRGALANLGLAAVVRATFLDDRGGASTLPAVSFTIKIRSPGS